MTLGKGWPRALAWGATVAVLVLAIAPGEEYDPTVAVLTATVVAAIWAGYWAFRAVHPPAAVKVDLGVETEGGRAYRLKLRPSVVNPTLRTIEVYVWLDVWLLDAEKEGAGELRPRKIPLSGLYRGKHPTRLAPNDGFTGYLDLTDKLRFSDPHPAYGTIDLLSQKALARFRVAWTDDLCEEGEIEPKYWHIEVGGVVSAVVDPERVKDLFEDLP